LSELQSHSGAGARDYVSRKRGFFKERKPSSPKDRSLATGEAEVFAKVSLSSGRSGAHLAIQWMWFAGSGTKPGAG
jgi:hypothetical protein